MSFPLSHSRPAAFAARLLLPVSVMLVISFFHSAIGCLSDVQCDSPLSKPCRTPGWSVRIVFARFSQRKDFTPVDAFLAFPSVPDSPHCYSPLWSRHCTISHTQWPHCFPAAPWREPSLATAPQQPFVCLSMPVRFFLSLGFTVRPLHQIRFFACGCLLLMYLGTSGSFLCAAQKESLWCSLPSLPHCQHQS